MVISITIRFESNPSMVIVEVIVETIAAATAVDMNETVFFSKGRSLPTGHHATERSEKNQLTSITTLSKNNSFMLRSGNNSSI
jgi:hypothetical protein